MKSLRAEAAEERGGERRVRGPFWSEKQARELLAEQQGSGRGIAEFARKRGFPVKRLYWWKAQIAKRDPRASMATPAFLPVRVVSSEQRASAPARSSVGAESASLEVVVGAGRVIRVRSDFDPALLCRLVRTLEREGSC
jgi:hypothetical protein